MMVLTPGAAKLDSVLGKIPSDRLNLSSNSFFIAASCDMIEFGKQCKAVAMS